MHTYYLLMKEGGIHQLSPYLWIPWVAHQVWKFFFKLGFLNLLQCTNLAIFAISQNLHPHTFPVVQTLDGCVCPLVSIVSRLVVSQMEYDIYQWVWDNSGFKLVAIIYNGSKQNIIFDKVKFIIHTIFKFVMKFPNFWVLLLQGNKFFIF